MILSMTGYGKAVCEMPDKKITVELKSLNSKQMDLSMRLSNIYREKELDMRSMITAELTRGKVDASVYVEQTGSDRVGQINKPVVEAYFNQLKQIAQELGVEDRTDLLRLVMPLPETIKVETQTLGEEEWENLKNTLSNAIIAITDYRKREGEALRKDLLTRINNIAGFLAEVPKYESERIPRIRQRIESNINEILSNNAVDKNRLEQEMIFYIEKLDINEEKVRLGQHIKYFTETMDTENEPGKKLGFIAQEMGREINTLGSKANEANLQKLVIQMKDELEKIKEQVLNIL
ncbi:MAG: YicC family protein [Marinilabiliaceae bacterium]|mgnify:CR=1 FL=1|nr:YicC family protein [Marinilabiliaceae bacterium]